MRAPPEAGGDPPLAVGAAAGLTLSERLFIYCFLGLVAVFGILVEVRSAGLSRRMGDLDVYLRSAWAARVGADIYSIADDNDWHYCYPPFYAVALMPLADPPSGQSRAGFVPYGISVALFYWLNVVVLGWGAHVLAGALEEAAPDARLARQPRLCRRWWALRLWPILACIPAAAQTTMRGQVNILVLALLCLAAAGMMRRQHLRAGAFLALAICIKVIPVYLLVYPVWKRDVRTLLGCGLGLFLGLVALPLAALGPERTVHQYGRYVEVFFGPVLGVGTDTSREDELLGVNKTDSVGIKNALHNWLFLDPVQRPAAFPPVVVWGHRLLGGLMTLLVLWPGTRRPLGRFFELQQFASLVLLMAVLSPICHLHYLIFCLPLAACLMAGQWQFRDSLLLRGWLYAILAAFFLMNTIPSLPGLDRLKDLCVDMLGALPIWAAATIQLWRWRLTPPAVSSAAPSRCQAA